VKVVVSAFVVLVRRPANVEATTQGPQADANERRSNDTLAPSREEFDRRQKLAQEDAEQRDDDDARGMTQPPRPSGNPTLAAPIDCKRCDCGQMIGSGEHVEQAGKRAGHQGQHREIIMSWLWALWALGSGL
jgi:hypothetical protein